MDELFPPSFPGLPEEPEPTEHLDPLLDRRLDRRPWEVRAAQWRAWELAEEAFGPGVRVSLTRRAGAMGFRGLLSVAVPFSHLEEHRRREGLFLAWAWEDPVLSRVPLVLVFEPLLVSAP